MARWFASKSRHLSYIIITKIDLVFSIYEVTTHASYIRKVKECMGTD